MTDAMFAAKGRFYRGNLHTHSNLSDGVLEPAEVCRRYKAEGYDFIALTDHFVGRYNYPIADTTGFRDDGFTTLLGAELHSGAMENGNLWHILAVGLPADFARANAPDFHPVEDQETGPEIARRARDAGAFVAIAHPEWSGMTIADARSIDAAHSVEIYNHGCYAGCDRGFGLHTLDLLLCEGRKLTLCATDDAHFYEPDHFGGWVMVKAEDNSPEALIDGLKAGHHYSSQGPEFRDIRWYENAVEVDCSSVAAIIVSGKATPTVNVHGNSMTTARLPLDKLNGSEWMRVTLVDHAGKRAWSNPVWRG